MSRRNAGTFLTLLDRYGCGRQFCFGFWHRNPFTEGHFVRLDQAGCIDEFDPRIFLSSFLGAEREFIRGYEVSLLNWVVGHRSEEIAHVMGRHFRGHELLALDVVLLSVLVRYDIDAAVIRSTYGFGAEAESYEHIRHFLFETSRAHSPKHVEKFLVVQIQGRRFSIPPVPDFGWKLKLPVRARSSCCSIRADVYFPIQTLSNVVSMSVTNISVPMQLGTHVLTPISLSVTTGGEVSGMV